MVGNARSPVDAVEEWVRSVPTADGVFLASPPRRYNTDEAVYDARVRNDRTDRGHGEGLVVLARESGVECSAAALELGCGTGKLSVGLVASGAYPLTLITDPSPAFVEITRRKCDGTAGAGRTRFGVLLGEEIGRLPERSFSLIAMRAVLHHVTDVERFIADASRLLVPGGACICQEPCWDGLLMKGLLAQFGSLMAEAAGEPFPEEEVAKVRRLTETMLGCLRRDVDKSRREDKHGFRPDEVMKLGARHGLAVAFHPNVTFETFTRPASLRRPHSFPKAFLDHLAISTGLSPRSMRVFTERLRPCLMFLQAASRRGAGPYFYGVFVLRKGQDS